MGTSMNHILFLGSQSESRQMLLREAGIPFLTLKHHSSEKETSFNGNISDYVIDVARCKMESLVLPAPEGQHTRLVLTSDSMVQHQKSGQILGKPTDVDDAKRMLALARTSEMLIMTGCVLRQYSWVNNEWTISKEMSWATPTFIEFIVPENEVDYFLTKVPAAMFSAGAGILEEFGANYLKTVRGSFSGGRGLPIFELRCALRDFGFLFK